MTQSPYYNAPPSQQWEDYYAQMCAEAMRHSEPVPNTNALEVPYIGWLTSTQQGYLQRAGCSDTLQHQIEQTMVSLYNKTQTPNPHLTFFYGVDKTIGEQATSSNCIGRDIQTNPETGAKVLTATVRPSQPNIYPHAIETAATNGTLQLPDGSTHTVRRFTVTLENSQTMTRRVWAANLSEDQALPSGTFTPQKDQQNFVHRVQWEEQAEATQHDSGHTEIPQKIQEPDPNDPDYWMNVEL